MIDEAEATEDARAHAAAFSAAGTLRDVLDLAIRSVDHSDSTPERAATWTDIEQAHAQRTSVCGRLVLPVDGGAFVQLGPGILGYAPRLELPDWVPRRPRRDCLGRELEGILLGIDVESGTLLLSPRLLGLRRAHHALHDGSRITGSVVSTSSDGLVVDLDGARGFVPVGELPPDQLLVAPAPGASWDGYVTAATDAGVLLSHHTAPVRARRDQQRRRLLAELDLGSHTSGQVTGISADGALVAFEDGLVWGKVPRAALRSPAGQQLVRGACGRFQIVGRDETATVQLRLWPHSLP